MVKVFIIIVKMKINPKIQEMKIMKYIKQMLEMKQQLMRII